MGVQEKDPLAQLSLPPGFRFYPTDEELFVQYLCRKVAGHHFSLQIIAEIDLYMFDPWVLPSKAIFGEKEWYFFSPRDRKYPNGSRPNRVAGSGYWKATGTDKVITSQGRKVGIKKALVFYVGKAAKGTKTNWIMHEYRLSEPITKSVTSTSKLDDWVLCRIYKKSSGVAKPTLSKEHSTGGSSSSSSSHLDDTLEWLPDISGNSFALPRLNPLQNNMAQDDKFNLLQFESGQFDWTALAGLSSIHGFGFTGSTQPQSDQLNHNSNASDVYVLTDNNFVTSTTVDEEVQSGIRTQRLSNYSYDHNSDLSNPTHTNLVDPFGIRYLTQPAGFGSWKS